MCEALSVGCKACMCDGSALSVGCKACVMVQHCQ